MSNSVKIRFFGDFTTCEVYQIKYDRELKRNILRQKGYDYLLKDTKQYLENSFNIVNLESPITNCKSSGLAGKKLSIHWMDPEIAGDFLKRHNIHAVSLGNNHCLDYGRIGFEQTLSVLNKFEIPYFGAGFDKLHASKPFFKSFEIGTQKVNLYVFGGYKYREDYDKEFNFYANDNKPGVFILTPESIKEEIKNIKQNDKNSIVVIYPHFGGDYTNAVKMQVDYSKKWIDFGADFVIGHGPHMMNRIEYYNNIPLIYSLGIFLFPANFQSRMLPFNMIAELELLEENNDITIKKRLYPIHFETNSYEPITRPINENELSDFLSLLTDNNQNIIDKLKIFKNELIYIEI